MEIDYIIKENNETKYLLGYNGELIYYITEPSFNCDWYYGINHISCYNYDIDCMLYTHFLYDEYDFDWFIDEIKNEKLTENEKYIIADICKTMNTYREMADLSYLGHSNIALYDKEIDIVKNKELYEQCNEQIIKLWNLIKEIFEKNYNV